MSSRKDIDIVVIDDSSSDSNEHSGIPPPSTTSSPGASSPGVNVSYREALLRPSTPPPSITPPREDAIRPSRPPTPPPMTADSYPPLPSSPLTPILPPPPPATSSISHNAKYIAAVMSSSKAEEARRDYLSAAKGSPEAENSRLAYITASSKAEEAKLLSLSTSSLPHRGVPRIGSSSSSPRLPLPRPLKKKKLTPRQRRGMRKDTDPTIDDFLRKGVSSTRLFTPENSSSLADKLKSRPLRGEVVDLTDGIHHSSPAQHVSRSLFNDTVVDLMSDVEQSPSPQTVHDDSTSFTPTTNGVVDLTTDESHDALFQLGSTSSSPSIAVMSSTLSLPVGMSSAPSFSLHPVGFKYKYGRDLGTLHLPEGRGQTVAPTLLPTTVEFVGPKPRFGIPAQAFRKLENIRARYYSRLLGEEGLRPKIRDHAMRLLLEKESFTTGVLLYRRQKYQDVLALPSFSPAYACAKKILTSKAVTVKTRGKRRTDEQQKVLEKELDAIRDAWSKGDILTVFSYQTYHNYGRGTTLDESLIEKSGADDVLRYKRLRNRIYNYRYLHPSEQKWFDKFQKTVDIEKTNARLSFLLEAVSSDPVMGRSLLLKPNT